jgi:hypothetical protein
MQIKAALKPCAFAFLILLLPFSVRAQASDHLTPQEIQLVQDAQALDQRIEVFIKAMQRRMMVLSGAPIPVASGNKKEAQKEAELWGDLPTGSRAKLIDDIAQILDESITNIDDVSMHDEKNPLIPKALRKLSAAATQIGTQLAAMKEQTKDRAEIAGIEQTLESAQTIVDATTKLPPPVAEPEKSKAKTKKPKG